MGTFFTSDTHFGNDGIIERENRPFKNWKQFARKTIRTWNKQAGKDDVIYFLGDFVYCFPGVETDFEKAYKLVKKIRAKVVLILGNNDEMIMKLHFDDDFEKFCSFLCECGFLDVKREEFLNVDGLKIYLNHKPSNFKAGYVNLFGHTHRTTGLWKPFGLNVGCDLNHFRLYDMAEIERLLDLKTKYWDDDKDNLCMGGKND